MAEGLAAQETARENADKSRSWWNRFGSGLAAIIAVVAAVVTVATSMVDVLFAVDPNSRPADEALASMTRISIEQAVSFGEYVGLANGVYVSGPRTNVGILVGGDRKLPDPPMHEEGILVLVKAEVRGISNRLYSATAEVLNVKTNSKVHYGVDRTSLLLSTCDMKMAELRSNGITFRCWMRNPPTEIRYRVRVKLYAVDDKSAPTLADFIETEEVTCCGTSPAVAKETTSGLFVAP
ncbi:hypothetical protein [Nonomuraea bangladeshensis]|uniref:hypothetical protein n=1 Tax=Nonomuraea bangladeshensis TaxID=404385 RepID=UPI003C2FB252